ncbi:MAG: sugar phosphate nucleotidyltransferase [Breznakia sp.]
MNLTYNQFEALVYIDQKQDEKISQRKLADALQISLGNVNSVLQELGENEFLIKSSGKYEVTKKGYEALAPYRVKKAIFIAAGFGSRLVPITLNTPKPLIRVHGKRIIDSLLAAVAKAEIEDITIVRGYLGEQFDVLKNKYPQIKFIENPMYNEANNISSAYLVRAELDHAYVLESDLVLYNSDIIRKYEYNSNYCGIPVEVSDDWCFQTSQKVITHLGIGGRNCYQMVGISYWDSEDANKMKDDLKMVFESPGGKELYWDEVALGKCMNKYKLHVKSVKADDIIEIDTTNELKEIDPIYNV